MEIRESDVIDWTITIRRRGKISRFLLVWRNGREAHFPICCILRFAIQDALEDGKTKPFVKGQAVCRGGYYNHPRAESVFVPCNIFHHQTEGYWETYESSKSKDREKE